MKKIYYIETTLNGYVIKKIEICDFKKGKDYCGLLDFERDGEEIEYYNDIAGSWDDIDQFLEYGIKHDCEEYEDILDTKDNIYLEYWYTNSLGYYDDRYIGLMVGEEIVWKVMY